MLMKEREELLKRFSELIAENGEALFNVDFLIEKLGLDKNEE